MSKDDLDDFRAHLVAAGKSKETATVYVQIVASFLKHVGEPRIDRISEELTRSYFAAKKNQHTKSHTATAISQFLKFAAARLPVVVNARGASEAPRLPTVKSRKELAVRQAWEVERQAQQRETEENLVAKLARELISVYVFLKRRIKGGPEDLDELYRLAAECEELIQGNLPLFMELSAKGLNVGSIINSRAQNEQTGMD